VTEDTTYILLWMLIVFSLGLIIGWTGGEELSRRRCAEEKVEALRDQLEQATTQQRQLRQLRNVLNDAHKRIMELWKYIAPH